MLSRECAPGTVLGPRGIIMVKADTVPPLLSFLSSSIKHTHTQELTEWVPAVRERCC